MTTELLKLRTVRSIRWFVLGALAFAAFLGAVGASIADDAGDIVAVSSIPAIVALVLGVLASAGEYQHGTITTTFLTTPRRHRVVAAKTAAVAAVVGPVLATTMAAVAVVAATPTLLGSDTVDLLDGETVTALGESALAAALLGGAGVGLGFVLRSQIAAVVAVAAWLFAVEGIAGNTEWGPTGRPGQIAGFAVATTLATLLTQRRDIA